MVLQPKDGIGIISHSAMKTLIGSCVDQVPELLDRYRPDGMLSVATKPKLTPSLPTGRHLSLRFADIDRPAPRNRSLAAKPDDIDAIRSSSDCDRLLMHCRQGQRRSPRTQLIVLNGAYSRCRGDFAERLCTLAPYVECNAWIFSSRSISQRTSRIRPPCYPLVSPHCRSVRGVYGISLIDA
jgi:predicted protein tyrosine phosphatase